MLMATRTWGRASVAPFAAEDRPTQERTIQQGRGITHKPGRFGCLCSHLSGELWVTQVENSCRRGGLRSQVPDNFQLPDARWHLSVFGGPEVLWMLDDVHAHATMQSLAELEGEFEQLVPDSGGLEGCPFKPREAPRVCQIAYWFGSVRREAQARPRGTRLSSEAGLKPLSAICCRTRS